MNDINDIYEVHALRYGTHTNLLRAQCFLGNSVDPLAPCPLDFSVWLIRNETRTVLVDCGVSLEEAAGRDRHFAMNPRDCLLRLGIEPAEVSDLVLTHMHWDHAGTLGDFPERPDPSSA